MDCKRWPVSHVRLQQQEDKASLAIRWFVAVQPQVRELNLFDFDATQQVLILLSIAPRTVSFQGVHKRVKCYCGPNV